MGRMVPRAGAGRAQKIPRFTGHCRWLKLVHTTVAFNVWTCSNQGRPPAGVDTLPLSPVPNQPRCRMQQGHRQGCLLALGLCLTADTWPIIHLPCEALLSPSIRTPMAILRMSLYPPASRLNSRRRPHVYPSPVSVASLLRHVLCDRHALANSSFVPSGPLGLRRPLAAGVGTRLVAFS